MGDTEIPNKGYLKAGEHSVYPWAISGLESSIVVRGPQKNEKLAFDMGYAHREAVTCSDVFIRYIMYKFCNDYSIPTSILTTLNKNGGHACILQNTLQAIP